MIQKMKSAKPVYLSSEKMEFMDNTDTGKILNSDNALELGKEKAKKYGKDWDRLEKGIESGKFHHQLRLKIKTMIIIYQQVIQD